MLVRFDPFRELDRLAQQVWGGLGRFGAMPMDVWRRGDRLVASFDLPGVPADSIHLTVEDNVLTVSAERKEQPAEEAEVLVAERPQGSFSRQLLLADGLDTDKIEARYDNGVLTVEIPVAEHAKPRRIEIHTDGAARAIEANATAA
ncbi:MAG TPA: Hsp20/alpha crystallin family protein [Acidimicrobiales bacterium]|jgi:HSP20 family protein|nr:Hsp20/alpha crystallin family protein [Acidimicrobiales bacterium]